MVFTNLPQRCPACKGQGSVLIETCFTCNGNGHKPSFASIDIDIPRSVDNGNFLRVPNSGDYYNGLGVGDLVIQIKLEPDENYEKIGNAGGDDFFFYMG